MATLDLSKAKTSFYMDDPKLVSFGTLDGTPTSTTWSYLTPAGHKVTVTGTGMTFDGGGRAIAGTATSIAIDVGNDGSPDLFDHRHQRRGDDPRRQPASFWALLQATT